MSNHKFSRNQKILFAVGGIVLVGAAAAFAYFSNGSLYKGYLVGPLQNVQYQHVPIVGPPQTLAATCAYSPATPYAGETINFTITASGGTSPYSYAWPSNVTQDSVNPNQGTASYSSSGANTVNVVVKDSANSTPVTATCSFSVAYLMQAQPIQQHMMQAQPIQQHMMQAQPIQQHMMQPQPLQPAQQNPLPVNPSQTPPPAQNPPASAPAPSPVISLDCTIFSDLKAADPDCAAIGYANSVGAMTGNPNGTFDPNALLQRDQVAKIILVAFKFYQPNTDYCGNAASFPDIAADAWSYQYICAAKSLGFVTGYQTGPDAGYYRPSRAISHAEFLAILLRSLGDTIPNNNSTSYADVPTGQWYSGYASYALSHNLFPGPNLNPSAPTTRREVARVLYTLYQENVF